MQRNNDHAGAEAIDGVGELEGLVAEELVGKTLANLDLRREDKVRIEELEAYAKFHAVIDRLNFKEFICALRAGICCKVVIEFATGQAIETEILHAVALELELEGQVHVDGLNRAIEDTVFRDAVFVPEPFFGKEEAGHKAEIYEAAKAQATHEAEVEPGFP